MKYIAFWEFDVKDMEKVVETMKHRVSTGTAKRKNLIDPHLIGDTLNGFSGLQSLSLRIRKRLLPS